MPPCMVGGGLGPGPSWPLGGWGPSMAEILYAQITLQRKEPGLARRILNLTACIVV